MLDMCSFSGFHDVLWANMSIAMAPIPYRPFPILPALIEVGNC